MGPSAHLWVLPLAGVLQFALIVGFAAAFAPEHMSFFLGLGLGVGLTTVAICADSPPSHIERWRQGAEGEQATGRALRRLAKGGWTVVHDVDRGHGNIDHIAVGPPGIFLIDSKDLHGGVSVERGRLSVRWREAPEDGYENRSLAPRIRVAARELEQALRRHGLASPRVQPVVALWAVFEQRSVLSGGVAWVRGKDLPDILERRPVTFGPADVDRVTAALRSAMTNGPLA